MANLQEWYSGGELVAVLTDAGGFVLDGDASAGAYPPATAPTRAGQLANNTGGTVDSTLVDVTTLLVADPTKVNANFADLAAKVNAIEAALHTLKLTT